MSQTFWRTFNSISLICVLEFFSLPLQEFVYLWFPNTRNIDQLFETFAYSDCSTSVVLVRSGIFIAIRKLIHEVHSRKLESTKIIRTMRSHWSGVGYFTYKSHSFLFVPWWRASQLWCSYSTSSYRHRCGPHPGKLYFEMESDWSSASVWYERQHRPYLRNTISFSVDAQIFSIRAQCHYQCPW